MIFIADTLTYRERAQAERIRPGSSGEPGITGAQVINGGGGFRTRITVFLDNGDAGDRLAVKAGSFFGVKKMGWICNFLVFAGLDFF